MSTQTDAGPTIIRAGSGPTVVFFHAANGVTEMDPTVSALAGQFSVVAPLAPGFRDLDEITAGLQPSELVILAARPSVGKTAFSLCLVRNILTETKEAVFFDRVRAQAYALDALAKSFRDDLSRAGIPLPSAVAALIAAESWRSLA